METTEILLKERCHADSCLERKSPPIDITRKYEKLYIVAFNRKLDYNDVIKMKKFICLVDNCLRSKLNINVICLVENCLSYNISKFGKNRSPVSEITSIEHKKMTSSMKNILFEFRCQYDDIKTSDRPKPGMHSYLPLIGF